MLFLILTPLFLQAGYDESFKKNQKYIFRYEIQIPPSLEGKKIHIWIPYPAENTIQKVLKFTPSTPWPFKVTKESKYGNRMIYVKGKVSQKSIKMIFEYEVMRFLDKGSKDVNKEKIKVYLMPDRLVPLFPEVQKISEEKSKGLLKPAQKVKAFYEYIVETMIYDKSGQGWGRGDAVWACSTKRGNCTDFHSLFIALNRSQKIPAKFEIGFPIPQDQEAGEISGYHCWAKAYTDDQGWIPVDTTEAKKTGEIKKYFGMLPSNRIHLSSGRDIILNPPQKGEPLNYFIYPYAESEGQPVLSLKKKLSFKKLSSLSKHSIF